jgi:hypothetical protein
MTAGRGSTPIRGARVFDGQRLQTSLSLPKGIARELCVRWSPSDSWWRERVLALDLDQFVVWGRA